MSDKPDETPVLVIRNQELTDSMFGVVAARLDTTCLGTIRRGLRNDTVIVVLPSRNVVVRAHVVEQIASCRGEVADPTLTYYRLAGGEFELGDLGIAVLSAASPVLDQNHTDIDGDGTPESYRECASSEGVHLTVWAGDPLRGKRVWHYYYYLGYDVEPTCTDADFS